MNRDKARRQELALARYLVIRADVARAIREVEAALRGCDAIEFHVGVDLFNKGDFDAAIDWFETGNEHHIASLIHRLRVVGRQVNPKDLA